MLTAEAHCQPSPGPSPPISGPRAPGCAIFSSRRHCANAAQACALHPPPPVASQSPVLAAASAGRPIACPASAAVQRAFGLASGAALEEVCCTRCVCGALRCAAGAVALLSERGVGGCCSEPGACPRWPASMLGCAGLRWARWWYDGAAHQQCTTSFGVSAFSSSPALTSCRALRCVASALNLRIPSARLRRALPQNCFGTAPRVRPPTDDTDPLSPRECRCSLLLVVRPRRPLLITASLHPPAPTF